jgi:hypothetical protein
VGRGRTAAGLVVALGIAGCGGGDDDDTAKFSGERKRVVETIEAFQAAMDDADGRRGCALFTPRWAQAVGRGAGGCEKWVEREMEGETQADIEVRTVRLHGADRATADLAELGEPLRAVLLRQRGEWKIDEIRELSG